MASKKKLNSNQLLKQKNKQLKVFTFGLFASLIVIAALTFNIFYLKEEVSTLSAQIVELQKVKQGAPRYISLNKKISCENIEVEQTAPACPEGSGEFIPPAFYPIHSVYMGYEKNITSSGLFQSILNVVFKSKPKLKVFIMVPKGIMKSALEELDPLLNDATKEQVEVVATPSDFTIWAQDYFETSLNRSTGEFSIIDLPYESDVGENIPSFLALACNSNLIGQSEINADRLTYTSGNYGGNIEALTDNLLVIGDNMHESQKEVLGKEINQKIVEIDVKWLLVGHVDELISLIPDSNRGGNCPFDILYASPDTAYQLLKEEKAKGKDLNINLGIGSRKDKKNFNLDECFEKGDINPICKEVFRANKTYSKIIQNNMKKIRDSLDAEQGNCAQVNFIPIPILFSPKAFRKSYGTENDEAITIDPNPVNNVVINNHLFLPKQNLDIFHQFTKKKLEKFNYKTNYVDGRFVHQFRGGIHCSLNFRRSCRPQN